MHLFALTANSSRRIVKFPLTAATQKASDDCFEDQEKHFTSYYTTKIPFDGKYKPDDQECLVISDYDDIDGVHKAIAAPLSIPEIAPSVVQHEEIKALFSGYQKAGDSTVLFQNFDKRRIISNVGLAIIHNNNFYHRVDGAGLSLDSKLAMILKNKNLEFASFFIAKSIFDMSEYYIEATDTDITNFESHAKIKPSSVQPLISVANSWVRRKVALIAQSQILDNVDAAVIKMAAAEFSITVQTEDVNGVTCVKLPDDKAELKVLLRFLDEDYYKSILSNKNFMTNSRREV